MPSPDITGEARPPRPTRRACLASGTDSYYRKYRHGHVRGQGGPMAENTEWFEGHAVEENRRPEAPSVAAEHEARMHYGPFVLGGNIVRAMSVLLVLALLGAGVMTFW